MPLEITAHYPLKNHNTLAIDVQADWWITFLNSSDLQQLARDEFFASLPFIVIGSGSNLLFTESYRGALLHSINTSYELLDQDAHTALIRVGAGMEWDQLVERSLQEGLFGLENLSLIPGTVGASAVQNIGAYGVEVKEFIERVEAVNARTGQERTFTNSDCHYGYRYSIFKEKDHKEWVITHVVYKLHRQPKLNLSYASLQRALNESGQEPSAETIRKHVVAIREAKLPDPAVLPNAGSFFMNPIVPNTKWNELLAQHPDMPYYPTERDAYKKLAAGWLIEQCGFKKETTGKVSVYEKQALILVNRAEATGKEVANFAQKVVSEVEEKFGITLTPEVLFIP